MKHVYVIFHNSEIKLPIQCVQDCTAQGANDDAVDFWQRTCAEIEYPSREAMITGLLEYGAWSEEELNALNDDELEQKVLWISCHNAKDEMNEGA